MKTKASLILCCFVLAAFVGCERTETAIDLYKTVKDDARQKAQQAQEEAQKTLEKKAKDALSSPRNIEDESSETDKARNQ